MAYFQYTKSIPIHVNNEEQHYATKDTRTNVSKVVRSCSSCNATSTCQWRIGPNKTVLCNRCGLKARKEIDDSRASEKKMRIDNLIN